MDKFKEIIDTYFKNYSSFEYGKVTFECDYGELIFLNETIRYVILIVFIFFLYIETKDFVVKFYII